MAWERDLPAGVPTKITLFDEDFVVVRGKARDAKLTYADGNNDFDEPIALVDRCSHRLANPLLTPSEPPPNPLLTP